MASWIHSHDVHSIPAEFQYRLQIQGSGEEEEIKGHQTHIISL